MSGLDLMVVHPGRGGAYQGLGALAAVEPPLWARIVADYCQRRGSNVELVDCEALGMTPSHLAWRVATARPRLLAIAAYGHQPSASTQSMSAVREIVQHVAGSGANVPIILLGGHPSALPERTALEEGTLVAVGEGPVTVERLLAVLQSGDSAATVPGLAWAHEGCTVVNQRAPLLPMEELSGDVWDMLPMARYRAHNWQGWDGAPLQPYASVHTSLGCPYTCEFCCINAPFGGNRYRMRRPIDVIREFSILRTRHDVRTFKVTDEMFALNPRHVGEVCAGLAEHANHDGSLSIWAYARVDTVDRMPLPAMRAAGVRWLALGIEAADGDVLDASRKGTGVGLIAADAVAACRAAGISVVGNFIFGLPGESRASMERTLEMALELRCEYANFYCAMAYPGSALHARTPPGMLPPTWGAYAQHAVDCHPLAPEGMAPEEVLDFRDLAFIRYFTDPGYRRHLGARFGEDALGQVDAMLGHRLERAHRVPAWA